MKLLLTFSLISLVLFSLPAQRLGIFGLKAGVNAAIFAGSDIESSYAPGISVGTEYFTYGTEKLNFVSGGTISYFRPQVEYVSFSSGSPDAPQQFNPGFFGLYGGLGVDYSLLPPLFSVQGGANVHAYLRLSSPEEFGGPNALSSSGDIPLWGLRDGISGTDIAPYLGFTVGKERLRGIARYHYGLANFLKDAGGKAKLQFMEFALVYYLANVERRR